MINFIDRLKPAAKRLGPVVRLVRQITFLRQRAAHRALIRPYQRPRASQDTGEIVPTPLITGYFETGLGLGEYARGLASALAAAKSPFHIYPYNAYTGRPRQASSWAARYDVDRVHAVNIFCMAADQTRNARRIIGSRHTERSYNILSTFWELPRAPESWRRDLEFFDELWVATPFVANAFRPTFAKPIIMIPPCVDVDQDVRPDRGRFGLDTNRFYFLFSFDVSSHPQRKNPAAAVAAFELAFGDRTENVGLVLKISGRHDHFPREMSELENATKRDRRITILRGDWDRADVLALMASADCYLSLHRSEGFGLSMAESMLLGKPVIGTGFSGNAEFLTAETGFPVPYTMRDVQAGEYPYYAGNCWAEPDLVSAAQWMRLVAGKSGEARERALRGQAYIQQHYGPDAVSDLVNSRLRELGLGPTPVATDLSDGRQH